MNDAPHIMIVESPYYEEINNNMVESVLIELASAGATYERFEVPGSFELPGAIRMAIESDNYPTDRKQFDGYIALGCVIRGETSHYDWTYTSSNDTTGDQQSWRKMNASTCGTGFGSCAQLALRAVN